MVWRILVLLSLVWGTLDSSWAQEKDYAKIERQNWEKATNDLDFSEESKPTQEPEEPKDPSQPFSIPGIPSLGLGQVLMWAIIIGLAVLVITLIIRTFHQPVNVKVKNKKSYSVEELTEELPTSDLPAYLQEALSQGDYRLALRVYYLMVIQSLDKKQYIQWKKEKTNGDYVREMAANPLGSSFRSVTLIFDNIWYGASMVTEPLFQKLSPQFELLLTKITNSSAGEK